jgi:hypothetical protein
LGQFIVNVITEAIDECGDISKAFALFRCQGFGLHHLCMMVWLQVSMHQIHFLSLNSILNCFQIDELIYFLLQQQLYCAKKLHSIRTYPEMKGKL